MQTSQYGKENKPTNRYNRTTMDITEQPNDKIAKTLPSIVAWPEPY
jgi:hypothetical protein